MKNALPSRIILTGIAFFAGVLFANVLEASGEQESPSPTYARPTADQLSQALVKKYTTGVYDLRGYKPVSDCSATVFLNSAVSSPALIKVVETDGTILNDWPDVLTDRERTAVESKKFIGKLDACVETFSPRATPAEEKIWVRDCMENSGSPVCPGLARFATGAVAPSNDTAFEKGGYASRYDTDYFAESDEQREVPDSTGPDPAPITRPSVEELRNAIESEQANMGYTDEVALCAARVLVNSKLSDETLRNAVEGVNGPTTPPLTAEDQRILNSKRFKMKYSRCTAMLPSQQDKKTQRPSN